MRRLQLGLKGTGIMVKFVQVYLGTGVQVHGVRLKVQVGTRRRIAANLFLKKSEFSLEFFATAKFFNKISGKGTHVWVEVEKGDEAHTAQFVERVVCCICLYENLAQ